MLAYQPVGTVARYPALERLICAAVSNTQFAQRLVASPSDALAVSEFAHGMTLEEQRLVSSIQGAQDIHDFARRLYERTHIGASTGEQ